MNWNTRAISLILGIIVLAIYVDSICKENIAVSDYHFELSKFQIRHDSLVTELKKYEKRK